MLGTMKVKVSPVRCRMDVHRVYGLWTVPRAPRAEFLTAKIVVQLDGRCSEDVQPCLVGTDVLGQP
jgi:hypothetical protein